MLSKNFQSVTVASFTQDIRSQQSGHGVRMASLEVIGTRSLIDNSAKMGRFADGESDALRGETFVHQRSAGKLMIGIEFMSRRIQAQDGVETLHKIDKVLFAQMVVTQC